MGTMDVVEGLTKKLGEAQQHFKGDIASIRGSRPTPALVEDIVVDYYGQQTPLKQLASIIIVPPREIQVSVWDAGAVRAVEKTISEKLNLNAASEGTLVRVAFPPLTQERRDEIIKLVRSKAEEVRIKSRMLRDEAKKEVDAQKKTGDITEDDRFEAMEKIQEAMDVFNKQVEDAVGRKVNEISG
jgi:ribosome recycling factor